jgi:D-alanine-D-alanine ligase
MKKIDKHIQVVRTQTVRQSSMGEKSCLMIRDVLRTKYQTVDITNIDNEQDLEALVALQPDLVFLGLKQTSQKRPEFNGEGLGDIWVSEYLAQRGINFTGSSHTAMALDQNKALAKRKVAQAGLPTAPYFTATPGQYKTADELPLGFPLFVKPPNQGGGKGIAADSVVHTFAQYQEKVQQIQQLFAIPALVETYLGGREFSVGLLGAADT